MPDKYEGAADAIVNQAGSTDSCPLDLSEIDDVCKGTMLASLAITDENADTLKKVGKANPWHIEALRIITGSVDQAHKPLSTILDEDMGGLKLDKILDISGMTKGGHFLDTQGYIAHNVDTIVLSFRCTTSASDWLTNLDCTASEWEIDEDLEQGFSGYCSGFEGWCCGSEHKPRVHTGFYNNFLASLPYVKQYIEPLLAADQPPRKLFVTGHSLGAGIATLAGCYFLLEHDWTQLPHQFVNLTAGSPRACCESMADVIRARLDDQIAGGADVHFYRVVKGRDVVTKLPPRIWFVHLIDPIKILDDGKVVWGAKKSTSRAAAFVDNDGEDGTEEMKGLVMPKFDEDDDSEDDTKNTDKKYKKLIKRVPKSLRDHMPDHMLKPLFRARGIRYGSKRPEVVDQPLKSSSSISTESENSDKEETQEVEGATEEPVETTKEVVVENSKPAKRKWRLFGRRKSSKAGINQ